MLEADIVTHKRDEVGPRKQGADRETLTLNSFPLHPLVPWSKRVARSRSAKVRLLPNADVTL